MDTVTADLPEHAAPEATAAPSPQVGGTLGPYEIVSPIASGGMGRVWLGVRRGDYGFSRTFAVKTMREDLANLPEFRRRFLAEARLAGRVRHTNVVEVVDLGTDGGVVYQVMDWVEGASLSKLAARGPKPPLAVSLRIVGDVLRGLHAAHELRGDDGALLGLVHRDVSPQNILVGIDGVSKITDFGIAKATAEATSPTVSAVLGKPRFIAPEELEGGAVDRRTDLFAMGVVFWELLRGEQSPGFAGDLIVGNEVPLAIAGDAISEIAARALARSPTDRFASAAEMANAIDEAAATAGLVLSSSSVAAWVGAVAGADLAAERETRAHRVDRTRAHSRTKRNVAALALAVITVAIAAGLWFRTTPAAARSVREIAPAATAFALESPPVATSLSRPPRTAPPTPVPVSRPRAKYGNPYER